MGVTATLTRLHSQLDLHRPVLLDALARELYREAVELKIDIHAKLLQQLKDWIAHHVQYLNTRETITCVGDAQVRFCMS